MYTERAFPHYLNRTRHILGILVIGLLVSSVALAEIQKWTDKDGRVHFGDRAPDGVNAESVTVNPVTYENPEIDDLDELFGRDRRAPKQDKVIMYSTEWCGVCKKARNYFKQNSIPFVEYDVEKSTKGKRDYKRLNAKGVPVILVGDRRMNGFSVSSFRQIYSAR